MPAEREPFIGAHRLTTDPTERSASLVQDATVVANVAWPCGGDTSVVLTVWLPSPARVSARSSGVWRGYRSGDRVEEYSVFYYEQCYSDVYTVYPDTYRYKCLWWPIT
eukprot:1195379-Prorocentrum_minimum.AAC.6